MIIFIVTEYYNDTMGSIQKFLNIHVLNVT